MSAISFGPYSGTISNHCSHIEDYKSKEGLNSFEIVHGLFVACMAEKSRKAKARDCSCKEAFCTKRDKRVHACLYCAFLGCFGEHILKHAKDRQHYLAMDVNFGYVYCFECKDYKYDSEFEMIAFRQRKNTKLIRPLVAKFLYHPEPLKESVTNGLGVICRGLSKPNTPVHFGVRGIINMGSTCYISVILQSLVHAPVIANYYLSDDHHCNVQMSISPFNIPSKVDNFIIPDKTTPICFSCEMGKIVQEFYSGKVEPYVPDRFLFLFWLHVKSLAGYNMHDAHEFFLQLLDLMHQYCKDKNGQVLSSENNACCIMDKVFTGFSQTEFKCSVCKVTSIKPASFLHISLNFDISTLERGQTPTVTDCLQRMTQIEKLSKYACETCKCQTEASMRFSLKKLPIIITFLLNREPYLKFPETIDMTPYMPSEIQGSSSGQNSDNSKAANNKFYLFAVVKHTGRHDSGHYVSYVRMQKGEWYLFNDEIITLTDISEIQTQPAYLLFYHKEDVTNKTSTATEAI